MTSRSEIFGFKFESQDFQIYSYADETGLLSHATIQEVDRARFAFLVNAPLDVLNSPGFRRHLHALN